MGLHYRLDIEAFRADPDALATIVSGVRALWPCPHVRFHVTEEGLCLTLSGHIHLYQSCEETAHRIVRVVEAANRVPCSIIVELTHMVDREGREASEVEPYRHEHHGQSHTASPD